MAGWITGRWMWLPLAAMAAWSCSEKPGSQAPAEMEVEPVSLDFGTTAPGSVVRRGLTIHNRGSEPLTLSELAIVGDGAGAFSVEPLPAMEIAGGDSVAASVIYGPRATGSHTAGLLVRGDAANLRELAVLLTGTAATGDPCAKIACNMPPGPCYEATGTCSGGSCKYALKADNTPCNDGNACTDGDVCQAGLCRGTPKSCTTPPAGSCKDSTSFTAYASPGSCVAGVCQYSASVATCAGGCASNVCQGNPCQGVVCNSPPVCFTGGSCSNGVCQYQPNPGASCDDGDPCTTGDACGPTGVCAGKPKSCNAPPAAFCVNAQTSRTYDAAGSCGAAGTCTYVSHDTVCGGGCDAASGQCKNGCGVGTHLCGGVCVPDSFVTSCGTSCTPCPTGPNGTATCDGTSCGLTCNAGFSNCATGCCPTGMAPTAVSIGVGFSCAVTATGGARCWGDNSSSQLGDGTTTSRLTPVDVVGLASGVKALAGGMEHTCALMTAGGVKCWGYNAHGELGYGNFLSRPIPTDVVGLTSGVMAIAVGDYHSCALTSAGGVKCWGYNAFGQIGDGATVDRATAVDVVGLTAGVQAVAAHSNETCAITAAGGVKCWGSNYFGQLGDGTKNDRSTPVDVVGLSSGTRAAAAGGDHACAIDSLGGVKCWGDNSVGQLGDGTTTSALTPVGVVGLASGARAISLGTSHNCVLTSTGGVKCWGYNRYGSLGDGTAVNRATPVDVTGLTSGVLAISASGWGHACALGGPGPGTLKCWGANAGGQIGDGTSGVDRLIPANVVGF